MESRMKMKKRYTTPSLVVHGSFEKLTQHGGGSNWDVPAGTVVVVGPNTLVSSVTS